MSKQEMLKELNKRIDKLIIDGKEESKEFTRLCKMHKKLVKDLGLIK